MLAALCVPGTFGQQGTLDFRSVVERKLRDKKLDLSRVCPSDDFVAERVFRDYGAIFVSKGTAIPNKCVFVSEAEVAAFQTGVLRNTIEVGDTKVTLQKAALDALVAAREEAARSKLAITPRGGSTASMRSYQTTLDLWRSRFEPGLNHWTRKGKIGASDATAARRAATREQVEKVLEWEKSGLWFSKDLSKSILYSVAVPGASQHIFMLALDVEQFADARVRKILAKHGWFQTVKSDLPHFTYLGVSEDDLPRLGLKRELSSGQTFWIPDIKE